MNNKQQLRPQGAWGGGWGGARSPSSGEVQGLCLILLSFGFSTVISSPSSCQVFQVPCGGVLSSQVLHLVLSSFPSWHLSSPVISAATGLGEWPFLRMTPTRQAFSKCARNVHFYIKKKKKKNNPPCTLPRGREDVGQVGALVRLPTRHQPMCSDTECNFPGGSSTAAAKTEAASLISRLVSVPRTRHLSPSLSQTKV